MKINYDIFYVGDGNFLFKIRWLKGKFLHVNPVISREIIARMRHIVEEMVLIDFVKTEK